MSEQDWKKLRSALHAGWSDGLSLAALARLEQQHARMREALGALLADSSGCPVCDAGALRESAIARGADHWPECAYPKAKAALSWDGANTKETQGEARKAGK
jgi:hypothetical protein